MVALFKDAVPETRIESTWILAPKVALFVTFKVEVVVLPAITLFKVAVPDTLIELL